MREISHTTIAMSYNIKQEKWSELRILKLQKKFDNKSPKLKIHKKNLQYSTNGNKCLIKVKNPNSFEYQDEEQEGDRRGGSYFFLFLNKIKIKRKVW